MLLEDAKDTFSTCLFGAAYCRERSMAAASTCTLCYPAVASAKVVNFCFHKETSVPKLALQLQLHTGLGAELHGRRRCRNRDARVRLSCAAAQRFSDSLIQ